MKPTACRAIALSTSDGVRHHPAAPAAHRSSAPGRRSRRRAAHGDVSPSPNVLGYDSDTSTMSSRSGSAPARRNSPIVPPACSDREHQPSASGGVATVVITRGACRFEQRPEAPEVRGRELDVGAGCQQRPLERTEEARQVVHAGPREQFGADREQRAVHPKVGPVLALAERTQERGRLAGAERDAQRVVGCQACGGLLGGQLVGMARPYRSHGARGACSGAGRAARPTRAVSRSACRPVHRRAGHRGNARSPPTARPWPPAGPAARRGRSAVPGRMPGAGCFPVRVELVGPLDTAGSRCAAASSSIMVSPLGTATSADRHVLARDPPGELHRRVVAHRLLDDRRRPARVRGECGSTARVPQHRQHRVGDQVDRRLVARDQQQVAGRDDLLRGQLVAVLLRGDQRRRSGRRAASARRCSISSRRYPRSQRPASALLGARRTPHR